MQDEVMIAITELIRRNKDLIIGSISYSDGYLMTTYSSIIIRFEECNNIATVSVRTNKSVDIIFKTDLVVSAIIGNYNDADHNKIIEWVEVIKKNLYKLLVADNI